MSLISAGKKIREHKLLIAVLILGSFFFFYRLGARSLWSSDEGRYAEIPREMLESGDLSTPYLNYVPYFEKPVLSYWLTAASFKLFGENEFAARFPVAFLGFLTILATFWFGSVIFDKEGGFFGALILTATAGFFLVSRYLVIDGPFTFFSTASLYLFYAGYAKGRGWYFIISYIFMGLAVLTKGLIGIVLPALIVGAFILVTRDFGLLKRARILWGAAIFLLVTVPWFLMVSLRNPAFFEFFFIREHFQRFLTDAASRHGTVFYFLIIGAIFFFPWTFFVPVAVKELFVRGEQGAKKGFIFLNLWWFLVLVFFSFSKSKLPPYILPITPPLALLVGKVWLDFVREGKNLKNMKAVFWVVIAAILALAAFVMTILLLNIKEDEDARIMFPFVVPVVLIFLAEAALLVLINARIYKAGVLNRRLCAVSFGSLAAMMLIGYPLVIFAMEKMSVTQSSAVFADEIRKSAAGGYKVAVFEGYERYSDIGFYLKKRVILVGDTVGELRMGRDITGDKEYFISFDRFKELIKGEEKVYCLMKKSHYNEMIENKVEGLRILKETPRGVLLSTE